VTTTGVTSNTTTLLTDNIVEIIDSFLIQLQFKSLLRKFSKKTMSNAGGFPGSVTTSTTTKVTPLIWFDATYLNTKEGALKAAVVVSY
jgi:hypothetical protein